MKYFSGHKVPKSAGSKKAAKRKRSNLLLIIIWALFAAMVLFLVLAFDPMHLVSQKPIVHNNLPDGYSSEPSLKGKLPAGFPKELVLVGGAEIIRGENTIDATGATQKKVDLLVKNPSLDIFDLYKTKMPKSGWTNTIMSEEGVKVLGFQRDNELFYVTVISKTATTSQLGLTLVTHK